MKVSFPHMGNLHIILSSGLRSLGIEPIVAPYNSKKNLSIGTRYSPEAMCLPYKLVLGNFIQAIEMGAEALLMIDCPGICRLGQYSSSAREVIKGLGYENVEFINLDLYKGKLGELYKGFSRASGNFNPVDLVYSLTIMMMKIDLLDKLERQLSYYRAREVEIGTAEKAYKKALKDVENALKINEINEAFNFGMNLISKTPIDRTKRIVNIDLTGEIYVVLDYFSNLEIEKELGQMGVQVNRKINLSDWTNAFFIPSFARRNETHGERASRFAKDFLKRDIGGDAIESIGDTAHAGEFESDGVVHLLPFTCMPEIISQNILPNVRNEKDIPVLSLVLDEQMGKAGYITRLEAFVDLVKRKKYSSKSIISI